MVGPLSCSPSSFFRYFVSILVCGLLVVELDFALTDNFFQHLGQLALCDVRLESLLKDWDIDNFLDTRHVIFNNSLDSVLPNAFASILCAIVRTS